MAACVITVHVHGIVPYAIRQIRRDGTLKFYLFFLFSHPCNSNGQTLISASKLDAQLYPILTKQTSDLTALKQFLSDKLRNVLADIEKAQIEITHHIKSTGELKPKDSKTADKISQVLHNLNAIVNKLSLIQNEFRSLVESIMVFVQNLNNTKAGIEQYFERLPIQSGSVNLMEEILQENQRFTKETSVKFRQLGEASERLIEQIHKQEPNEIKEHDINYIMALLDTLRTTFESQNSQRMANLRKDVDVQRFKLDLNDLFQQIDQLKQQLNDTHGQYKESAAAVKTTALAFDYFEQTIQVSAIDETISNNKQMNLAPLWRSGCTVDSEAITVAN